MEEQANPIRQFRLALLSLTALAILGTLGYHILEQWPILDSLYMTVITLGTVGFKEVHELDATGKIFTICLVVFGVTIVFWAGTSLIEAVVGEQIWHEFQRKKMDKLLSKLTNHYIICGFGRMGQQIVKDLKLEGVPHAVIEKNPEQLPKLIEQKIPYIEGNASDDEILKAAGIERANGLITVAPSDEDNVFITLSARALNPKLFIVARSIQEENEQKLKMAGANRVMSPYVMGGRRMATAVLRPNVLDFLDLAIHAEDVQMTMEELTINKGSEIIGKTLRQSGLKSSPKGVAVIALKRTSGKMMPNPSEEEILREGDVLIVLGAPDELLKVENEYFKC